MDTSLFGIGVSIIILLLDIWAIVSVWRSTKSTGAKAGWTLLIFILPLVGLAIWGVAGPRGVAIAPSSSTHSKG
ncbi:PLD nuclease N-terminal domain-containing protein [Pseudomonas typographi]|uniref:PLDc_N domain-containing protein n=1 Tax=Pseudomonas typographi TaxID=2715964 RepID=A0ABR7Z9N5_9PSED|nr:PLD nuclease N-terminal domain-containing protein [Pseudomonas typographi]MBD1553256.1 PLDc_N domain-containing protein [Pseudomonas typographi]MBD1602003.1 PLDc_N domain-containing protein [Pseudomonas typographi]